MKTLLVKPYNKSDHIQPPLGLGYLASSVRSRHKVRILDCIKDRITPEALCDILDQERPEVVGLQCYTYDIYNVREILRECKKRSITTVIGGPHPSTAPIESMEFFGNDLDYGFYGEAEEGFAKLLDRLDSSQDLHLEAIPGLLWRENGKIIQNDRSFTDNLDSLGMPAWDLIRPQEYPEAQHGAFFRNFPIAPIITTRGCPFSCTFCAGNLISGRRLRKRSIENIINEMETLYNDYGIREFHIIDDNFTLDRNFAKGLLKRIKESHMDISWAVPNGVRVDALDDELLGLMKDTGLYLVSLGIESGSDRVLKLMKKSITRKKITDAVDMIRHFSIDIAGFFILGFPGETIEDIRKTIDFSLKLDLIRANYFTYLPFPGTESFRELKSQGALDGVDASGFCFMKGAFTPEGIDVKRLKNLQREAFLRFFLRPRILVRNLLQVKSPRHFKYLFRRFLNWIVIK